MMRLASNRLVAAAWPVTLCLAVSCVLATTALAEDTKSAATTATTTTTTTTPAKKKTTTPSPCKGLDNAACTANAICTWYREAHLKSGKTRKAHCQKKPTRTAKKKAPATKP
jgi:hypothetical protein